LYRGKPAILVYSSCFSDINKLVCVNMYCLWCDGIRILRH